VRSRIPTVEIANHRDAAGARRPNAKESARFAVDSRGVGSQFFVNAVVGAFIEQKQVVGIQKRDVVPD